MVYYCETDVAATPWTGGRYSGCWEIKLNYTQINQTISAGNIRPSNFLILASCYKKYQSFVWKILVKSSSHWRFPVLQNILITVQAFTKFACFHKKKTTKVFLFLANTWSQFTAYLYITGRSLVILTAISKLPILYPRYKLQIPTSTPILSRLSILNFSYFVYFGKWVLKMKIK